MVSFVIFEHVMRGAGLGGWLCLHVDPVSRVKLYQVQLAIALFVITLAANHGIQHTPIIYNRLRRIRAAAAEEAASCVITVTYG